MFWGLKSKFKLNFFDISELFLNKITLWIKQKIYFPQRKLPYLLKVYFTPKILH